MSRSQEVELTDDEAVICPYCAQLCHEDDLVTFAENPRVSRYHLDEDFFSWRETRSIAKRLDKYGNSNMETLDGYIVDEDRTELENFKAGYSFYPDKYDSLRIGEVQDAFRKIINNIDQSIRVKDEGSFTVCPHCADAFRNLQPDHVN